MTNEQQQQNKSREWIHHHHRHELCISSCVMTLCNAIWKMVDVRRWSTRDYVTVTHTQVTHKRIKKRTKPQQPQRQHRQQQQSYRHRRPKTYRAPTTPTWKAQPRRQNEIDDHSTQKINRKPTSSFHETQLDRAAYTKPNNRIRIPISTQKQNTNDHRQRV